MKMKPDSAYDTKAYVANIKITKIETIRHEAKKRTGSSFKPVIKAIDRAVFLFEIFR